jgi:hypothetical protein
MRVVERAYPTNFGDLGEPNATDYSRSMLTIPVTRPIVAMSIKTFVPIALIVVCSALVFFVRPRYVEGRIGLGITAPADARRPPIDLERVAAGHRLSNLMMIEVYITVDADDTQTPPKDNAERKRGGDGGN